MRELLTTSNPKTMKGEAEGYHTAVLHFAPCDLAGCGNVCPFATEGCKKACLNTAGRGGIAKDGATLDNGAPANRIQQARVERTRLYFKNRGAFTMKLAQELRAHIARSLRANMTPVARLNGTSDLNWERVVNGFPTIRFLDYTKNYGRMIAWLQGKLPSNYHLTFSRTEYNEAECRQVLAMGGTVAVVFKGKLPETYLGARVIDGDKDDLRFLDPAGVVVGLKAKGRAKHDVSGFAVTT
jgi:hypothetical protein